MGYDIADIHDEHGDSLQMADPIFRNYGGHRRFHGEIHTIRIFHDFGLVKTTLQRKGEGRVLVVDGGGSTRFALLGDRLAKMGVDNGWAGIVLNGCLRDSHAISRLDIGVKALNVCPVKPPATDEGESGIKVQFASVIFCPGSFVYCDADGIMVSSQPL